MLIKLTDERGSDFQLNADLIEKVIESRRVGSEILLTTGRSVVCRETHEEIAEKVNNINVLTVEASSPHDEKLIEKSIEQFIRRLRSTNQL
jgi:uncharacterized protein YlzI (FlbEa/FlbD family)